MRRKETTKNRRVLILFAIIFMLMEIFIIPYRGMIVKASSISIPKDAKEYQGHYYKVYELDKAVTWSKAQQYCETKGGHLVTITSVGEEIFVENLSKNLESWIGAQYVNHKWKWVTNEKWSYENNRLGISSWGEWEYITLHSGRWKGWTSGTYSYRAIYRYICEWDTSRETILPDQVKLSKVKKVTSTSAMLSWKKVSNAKGYTIYMKTGKKGTYKKIADIKGGNTTAYYKTKLKKGKTYYFRVRAYKKIYGERSYGELSVPKSIKIK